tara:strand:- start:3488 stop:3856 length:369 start_codon:yes stop_codon:yes gene_type:complete
MSLVSGKITFKFDHLIKDYDKNETVADMYFDVFEYVEENVFNVSVHDDNLNNSLIKEFTDEDGDVLNKIKSVYSECSSFYVEEENLGGEVVMMGGEIIFTEDDTKEKHHFVIGEIYEDSDLR